jgi:hypothetical protein
MSQVKDRQNKREAKKAKRKLNHKAHVKAKNIDKNKPSSPLSKLSWTKVIAGGESQDVMVQ